MKIRVGEAVAAYFDALALKLREQVAEQGMARYAEGFHDGYLHATIQAGLQIDGQGILHAVASADNPYDDGTGGLNRPPKGFTVPRCGYLGCTEYPGHDGRHIIRITDNPNPGGTT